MEIRFETNEMIVEIRFVKDGMIGFAKEEKK